VNVNPRATTDGRDQTLVCFAPRVSADACAHSSVWVSTPQTWGDAFRAPYAHQCVTTVTVAGDATLDLPIFYDGSCRAQRVHLKSRDQRAYPRSAGRSRLTRHRCTVAKLSVNARSAGENGALRPISV